MKIADSRLTSQGQVSVPAEVRRRLGIGPGSVIEWLSEGDHIEVHRAHRYSVRDVHDALVGDDEPERKTLADLKEGRRKYVRKKHARG